MQQYLLLAVLKRLTALFRHVHQSGVATVLTVYGIETYMSSKNTFRLSFVATVLTVYGIETVDAGIRIPYILQGCNSTYRLRYATKGARQQRSEATMRSAHL